MAITIKRCGITVVACWFLENRIVLPLKLVHSMLLTG